ncbi:MAG: acetolactate decarboxylase [Candidatus Electrothrix sp. GM3_4]|nr:acetolactate decarboxylase [Candidatus Electrothrix sp. GM3_4]
MENVTGTLVGFRCPLYVKGLNVPGDHFHFISDDYSQGGHVLSFELLEGNGELDLLNKYFLRLPVNSEGFNQIDLSKDRTGELEEVEK